MSTIWALSELYQHKYSLDLVLQLSGKFYLKKLKNRDYYHFGYEA